MATYTDQRDFENDASVEDIQGLMVQKAHELFSVCDVENKGFINKMDMQRLKSELPLSPDQLENVFDSLDDDGNGFLTLEEFTEGFSSFLGLAPTLEKQESQSSSLGSELVYGNEQLEGFENEEDFDDVIDNLGATGMFEEVDVLKSMWLRLRRDEPDLLGNFEGFIARVSSEIKRSYGDMHNLESALRNKTVSHDEEVRKLYDEMENQIRLEKERVLAEEKARERQIRDEMEKELLEKDQQLREYMAKHAEMEEKLDDISSQDISVKQENEKLMKEKEELEILLAQSQRNLDESRSYVQSLRGKHTMEKRERAMAALQITEGIALERESLVKQLDMLRDMNKKLRDERDENDMWRVRPNSHLYTGSQSWSIL